MTPSARFRRADRVVSARDYAQVRRRGKRLGSRNFAVSVAPASAPEPKPESDSGSSPGSNLGSSSGSRHEPNLRREHSGHPSHTRLGLSVSRRVGNAVVRNRVKRAIREWFRSSRDHVPNDVDIVVIARQGAASRGSKEIAQELDSLMDGRRAKRAQRKSGVGE
jgi:ribonuclease P protein component